MVENLSNMIKEKIVKRNFRLSYGEGVRPIEPTIFRAYKINDRKIVITKKESEEEGERIFCNYLRDEFEMNVFFEGTSIEDHIMDNSTFGTHYSYGENPKCEFVRTSFSIYDETIDKEIYFFEGMWYPPNEDIENELVEDTSYNDIDDIIGLYIRLYLDEFFNERTEDDKARMEKTICEIECENEGYIMEVNNIICNCGSEWNNKDVAKNDVILMIKNNGYYPYIAEDRKALTRILAICEHGKIPNIGIYGVVDIQRKGKKKWEWDQTLEYFNSISGYFIDDFCYDCSKRKDSVICDIKIIPEIYNIRRCPPPAISFS